MNMWGILEIEKTKDSTLIRDQYNRIRLTTPPHEVKKLSAAYDFALKYAEFIDSAESYKEEMILEMAFVRNWNNDADSASFDRIHSTVHTATIYDDFLAQLQSLYNDFFSRKGVSNWERQVLQNAFWINNKAGLEPYIQDFLQRNRNLPSEVWQLFDNEYHWNDRINELSSTDLYFARCVLIETCQRWKLEYSFVSRDVRFNYEEYFNCRRLLREAALENDMVQVKQYFDKSIDIYTDDPIIYVIVATIYGSQPDMIKYVVFGPEYLHALNKLIKIHYDDKKYLIERAEYQTSCEGYDAACEDYEAAMRLNSDDLSIPYAIADIYNLQNQYGKAKAYLKFIKKSYQKAQAALESRMSTSQERDQISALIDSNDRVMGKVFEQL